MQVALIRHLPPAIAAGVCYGRLDCAARDATAAELSAIRTRLAHLHAPRLLSSPARRCRRLAEPLGEALGIIPAFDHRLLEMHFGEWEGVGWDEVDRRALDAWAADPWGFAPPGGESASTLAGRVSAFAHNLRACGGNALVVSHAGPISLLGPMLRGEAPDLLAPKPGFGAVTVLGCQPAKAAARVSTAHSVACSAAPSTSPV